MNMSGTSDSKVARNAYELVASTFYTPYWLQDFVDILSAFIAHLGQRPLSNYSDLTTDPTGTEKFSWERGQGMECTFVLQDNGW